MPGALIRTAQVCRTCQMSKPTTEFRIGRRQCKQCEWKGPRNRPQGGMLYTCPVCSTQFYRLDSRLKGDGPPTCSRSTRAKIAAKAKQRTGPRAWNWRGGKEPYYGPNWYEQARKTRERDRHTCQDCGHRQARPRLDVHHLRPRRLFNGDHIAANDLSNLVTLCRTCHARREATLTATLRPA